MKTQQSILKNGIMMALFCIILFAVAACGGDHGNSVNEKNQTPVSQVSVNPPSMDIYSASLMGNLEVVQQHIQSGTDLNKKDPYGSTPLIIAATFGKTGVARELIDAGADLNITNNDGATALHSAAFLCRKEIVQNLLDQGADKSIKNNFGSTALETVSGPFEQVKPIYDQFSKDLGPFGLKLDYEYIKSTRPKIADILR
jgi:hypothetical protein